MIMIDQVIQECIASLRVKFREHGIQIPNIEIILDNSLGDNNIAKVVPIPGILRDKVPLSPVQDLIDLQLEACGYERDHQVRGKIEPKEQARWAAEHWNYSMWQRLRVHPKGIRYKVKINPKAISSLSNHLIQYFLAHELWHLCEIEALAGDSYFPLITESTATYVGAKMILVYDAALSLVYKGLCIVDSNPLLQAFKQILYIEGAKVVQDFMKDKQIIQLLVPEVRLELNKKIRLLVIDKFRENPGLGLSFDYYVQMTMFYEKGVKNT